MRQMRIAAAQTGSVKGNVEANIATHLRVMETAAEQNVGVLVFPELSLTGYELELGRELAFAKDDPRLIPLAGAAREFGMDVLVGAPLLPDRIEGAGVLPKLGCIILRADGTMQTYAKMHLHSGEEAFFSAGTLHTVLPVGDEHVGVGICADTCHAQHPQQCAAMGATVYVAGVLVSVGGYAADAALFAGYAVQHGMLTVMANHNRPTGGWVPAGKSGIWTPEGLSAFAGSQGDALVMAERHSQRWALSVRGIG